MFKSFIHIFLLAAALPKILQAQQADTLSPVVLHAAETKKFTSAPVFQSMGSEDIRTTNSRSVADAARYFSGTVVKDYGGLGGLKTMSVRGLNANHTGVMYDGVMVADARAGQVDLGRISTENLQSIKLYTGGVQNELLPARSYAYAGVLQLIPFSSTGNVSSFRAALEGGSFGMANAMVQSRIPVNSRTSLAVSSSYLRADGGYPYPSYESDKEVKRKNASINQWRVDAELPTVFKDSSRMAIRLYAFGSRRGLPGAVIFYNEGPAQRLNNNHIYAQVTYRKNWRKNKLMIAGKSLFDRQQYIDPHYLNAAGFLENDFYQQEHYFSAGYARTLHPHWEVALSADVFHNTLRRKDDFDDGFKKPDRTSALANLVLQYQNIRWNASASLLHSHISQKVAFGDAGKDLNELNPSFQISLRPHLRLPLRVRAFYKNIFRAPSIDEQFYTYVGNADLRPEKTHQYNLGLVYLQTFQQSPFRMIEASVDGYYLSVRDKIMAVPRNNLFQWSMMNIGKSVSHGADVSAQISFAPWGKVKPMVAGSFTWLVSRDRTQRGSATYNKQLPYVPERSGSLRTAWEYGRFNWAWNALFASLRYRTGEQLPANRLEGYFINDLHLRYALSKKSNHKGLWTVQLALNNIFDQHYEIIQFFPMPGFHWQAGIYFSSN